MSLKSRNNPKVLNNALLLVVILLVLSLKNNELIKSQTLIGAVT